MRYLTNIDFLLNNYIKNKNNNAIKNYVNRVTNWDLSKVNYMNLKKIISCISGKYILNLLINSKAIDKNELKNDNTK